MAHKQASVLLTLTHTPAYRPLRQSIPAAGWEEDEQEEDCREEGRPQPSVQRSHDLLGTSHCAPGEVRRSLTGLWATASLLCCLMGGTSSQPPSSLSLIEPTTTCQPVVRVGDPDTAFFMPTKNG